jgi:TorA maturation chaperone TorD
MDKNDHPRSFMNTTDFLLYETDRCESYKLVSTGYYLPEEGTLEQLTRLEVVLNSVCPEAVEHVVKLRDEIDIVQLRVDYSKLFVGPFRLLAPPYGSVYLEDKREVMGVSTIDVRNRYQQAGLKISGEVKEAPDHIALELEFIYYLIFKEIESSEKSEFDRARDYMNQQQQFLKIHLGAWVPEFARAVEKNAVTGFYKNLARATRLLVQKDLDFTAELLVAPHSILMATS